MPSAGGRHVRGKAKEIEHQRRRFHQAQQDADVAQQRQQRRREARADDPGPALLLAQGPAGEAQLLEGEQAHRGVVGEVALRLVEVHSHDGQ